MDTPRRKRIDRRAIVGDTRKPGVRHERGSEYLNAARESVAKTKEAGMWKRLRDGNGRVYYFNERTKKTQWAMPELLLKQHQELEEQWESDDDANTAEI